MDDCRTVSWQKTGVKCTKGVSKRNVTEDDTTLLQYVVILTMNRMCSGGSAAFATNGLVRMCMYW